MFVRRSLIPGLIFCFLFAGTAFGAAVPKERKRPPMTFDTEGTPLQKAVKNAYVKNAEKKKNRMPGGENKDKCADAIARGNEKQIEQFCDGVGSADILKLADQNLKHGDGKAAGKRVVTRTKLKFKNPKQKDDDSTLDKWAPTKFKAFDKKKEHTPGPSSGKNVGGGIIPDSANNNDGDCVDWITGERFRGSACFDGTGKLLATLTPFTDELGRAGCRHRGGSVFLGDGTDTVEDDCYEKDKSLKTTLVESVDEDGPDDLDNDGDGVSGEDGPGGGNEDGDCIDGLGNIRTGSACSGNDSLGNPFRPLVDEDGPDSLDNDDDGLLNEDGPDSVEDDCSRLYKKAGLTPMASDRDSEGLCDLSRLMRKVVNDKAGQKLFKAKDDGTPDTDPDAEGIEDGEEERGITLTESFGVKCRPGTTFFDGVCVPDAEIAAAGEEFQVAMKMLGKPGTLAGSSEEDPNIPSVAMMGFTFAPPVIEWGYRIEEEVCILGICIEIFYARIGYEFDLAVGLRLPVEIEALDLPDSVLAGEDYTVDTVMTPLDFTSQQYSDFCRQHALDSDWYISDCTRFGFTNFLDEMVPIPANKKDGDEFVARYSVFAGLIVRVLGIPLLNWGIDSSLDIPAACTMMRIIQAIQDLPEGVSFDQIQALIGLLTGFGDGDSDALMEVVQFVKEVAGACGTFTTPFGEDEDGLRSFPFAGEYNIRADCVEAAARGEVITVKGKARPICTNMVLGISGASMGIGLGLEATLGSKLITADFNASEDATGSGDEFQWTRSSNEANPSVGLTLRPDNYDDADFKDTARVAMDDFTYYLNAIQITLKANLEFGGILSPIPDIGSFPIYSFVIDTGTFGLPIPQHPGTEAVNINIPVENYGLKIDVKPQSSDPAVRIDDKTLLIQPGNFGPYNVNVRNIGSRQGDFDKFRVDLSNRSGQTAPFTFRIDPNTDHDCVAAGSPCTGGSRLRGDPWDGLADACYLADGSVKPGFVECVNEDPPSTVEGLSVAQRDDDLDGIPDEDPAEGWATSPDSPTFLTQSIADLNPYVTSTTTSLALSINPFRHPLTKPGRYPFLITADSVEAKAKGMDATDPSGNSRIDATDVGFFVVQSFYEPQVVVLPNNDQDKAGIVESKTIEGTNGGNSPDSMTVQTEFLNFNQVGCTLTTLGRLPNGSPDCPYRAVPTAIPAAWTTIAGVPAVFPAPPGQLDPLNSSTAGFTVLPPRTWAGMDDTTYLIKVTTTSQEDPALPPATRSYTARQKVIATKESMTRYVLLEIDEMTGVLVAADAAGVKLGGLKPVVTKPMKDKLDGALAFILAGDFGKATGNISTTIKLMEAIQKMLGTDGKSLPPALFADLQARSSAMLADMAKAEASTVTSAP